MASDDETRQEYAEIWETIELNPDATEFAQTATMAPSEQTRITSDRGRPFSEDLPRIHEDQPGGDTMPELELKGSLGEGGTAEVLAADQVPLNREVAVKKLHQRSEEDSVYVLLQEAWVTGRLEHPNVVPVYRLGRDENGAPAIVMKRIEGTSWAELIADPSLAPRPFDADDPLEWHLDILMDVCDAVHYAHNLSIIHRDLKPENVMVGEFGEVYVVDWGLAVSIDDDSDSRLPRASDIDEPAGTPAFMAPEMAEGTGDALGVHTDVYLLGAMLHRVVTGEVPHEGDSLFEIMHRAYVSDPPEYGPDVPRPLADICQKAMARDPDERFASAEAFRRALVDFKRRRESIELATRARQTLQEFRATLESASPDAGDQEGVLYELFGECRFAFERALEVDEENERARRGLQKVMELMIEYELEHGGYKAASLLLTDLPDPRPDLEERLEELRERQADREEEYEKLKEYERQTDIERGRRARSLFVAAMGLVWGGISYAPGTIPSLIGFTLGYGGLLLQGAFVASAMGIALYVGRRHLFQNAANRWMVGSLLWAFIGIFLLRKSSIALGEPLGAGMVHEMFATGVATGVMAVTLDRRIFVAAVCYYLGGFIGSGLQDYIYAIDGLTDVVALSLLAFVWWPHGWFESGEAGWLSELGE